MSCPGRIVFIMEGMDFEALLLAVPILTLVLGIAVATFLRRLGILVALYGGVVLALALRWNADSCTDTGDPCGAFGSWVFPLAWWACALVLVGTVVRAVARLASMSTQAK